MIHQEVHAVLFQGDGVLLGNLNDLNVLDIQLIPAGSALIPANRPPDIQGAFLGQLPGSLPHLRGHLVLHKNALDETGAVAELKKLDLSAGTFVVQPCAQLHRFTDMFSDIANTDQHFDSPIQLLTRSL